MNTLPTELIELIFEILPEEHWGGLRAAARRYDRIRGRLVRDVFGRKMVDVAACVRVQRYFHWLSNAGIPWGQKVNNVVKNIPRRGFVRFLTAGGRSIPREDLIPLATGVMKGSFASGCSTREAARVLAMCGGCGTYYDSRVAAMTGVIDLIPSTYGSPSNVREAIKHGNFEVAKICASRLGPGHSEGIFAEIVRAENELKLSAGTI